jgi:hypothetical protein
MPEDAPLNPAANQDLASVPPPPDLSGAAPAVYQDTKADAEALVFGKRNYDEEAKEADHDRREKVRTHLLNAVILVFWLLVALAITAIFAFAWHYLTPVKWAFLSQQQLDKVQTMLFSGAGVGLAGFVSKKYLT